MFVTVIRAVSRVARHPATISNDFMDVDVRKGFSFNHRISSDIDLTSARHIPCCIRIS